MEETTEQENNRNPDGTFKDGFSGNPGGRPVNSMKSYVAKKLADMTDEQKDEWLKEHKISGDLQWRQAEGNPANNTDITSGGLPLILPATLIDKNNEDSNTPQDTGTCCSK